MAKKPTPPEHPEVGDPSVGPAVLPKPNPKSKIRLAKVQDPAAEEWFGLSAAAMEEAQGNVEDYLRIAPPLPSWRAAKHVTREILGRFLLDRDTHLIHDCENAVEVCHIDAIANGTFFHFWLEVPDDAGDPHPECIPE